MSEKKYKTFVEFCAQWLFENLTGERRKQVIKELRDDFMLYVGCYGQTGVDGIYQLDFEALMDLYVQNDPNNLRRITPQDVFLSGAPQPVFGLFRRLTKDEKV